MTHRFRFGLIGLGVLLLVALEVLAIGWVASRIGVWSVAGLLATTALGLFLMRREWRRESERLVRAISSGELPAGQMADATLVLLGGVLLVLPGFISDLVGLVLILPFSRPFVRSGLAWALSVLARRGNNAAPAVIKGEATVMAPPRIENAAEEVLRGEVVDG